MLSAISLCGLTRARRDLIRRYLFLVVWGVVRLRRWDRRHVGRSGPELEPPVRRRPSPSDARSSRQGRPSCERRGLCAGRRAAGGQGRDRSANTIIGLRTSTAAATRRRSWTTATTAPAACRSCCPAWPARLAVRLLVVHELGQAGQGQWITVYTNPGHAFVVIAGLRFDTGMRDNSVRGIHPGSVRAGPRRCARHAASGRVTRSTSRLSRPWAGSDRKRLFSLATSERFEQAVRSLPAVRRAPTQRRSGTSPALRGKTRWKLRGA